MKPQRIQRKRTKGWRKPDDAIIVSRPSKYGNPYIVASVKNEGESSLFEVFYPTAKEAVEAYEKMLIEWKRLMPDNFEKWSHPCAAKTFVATVRHRKEYIVTQIFSYDMQMKEWKMSEHTLAEKIAIAIPDIFTDYKGFRWWWDDVDPQYQIDIYKALIERIQSIMDGTYSDMDKLDKWIDSRYLCGYCEGTGNCQECDGEGDVGDDMGHLDCEDCDGSGECTYCEGTGKVLLEEEDE